MKRWPLRVHVYADAAAGLTDYTKIPGAAQASGTTWRVPVFAWEVTKSRRDLVDNAVTLVDTFRIYSPPGYFHSGQQVGDTPDKRWMISGDAEDNNNNPYWQPGLVVWYATSRQQPY